MNKINFKFFGLIILSILLYLLIISGVAGSCMISFSCNSNLVPARIALIVFFIASYVFTNWLLRQNKHVRLLSFLVTFAGPLFLLCYLLIFSIIPGVLEVSSFPNRKDIESDYDKISLAEPFSTVEEKRMGLPKDKRDLIIYNNYPLIITDSVHTVSLINIFQQTAENSICDPESPFIISEDTLLPRHQKSGYSISFPNDGNTISVDRAKDLIIQTQEHYPAGVGCPEAKLFKQGDPLYHKVEKVSKELFMEKYDNYIAFNKRINNITSISDLKKLFLF